MAVAPSNAAQLIMLAQQEIHHCHLQRRGLDLHLSALENLLKQVGDAFNIQPNLLPVSDLSDVVEPPAAETSSIDPPGFPQQLNALPEGGRRTGRKAAKRNKTPRATAPSVQPKGPVQILKAPARDPLPAAKEPAPPLEATEQPSIPAVAVPNFLADGNDDDSASSQASIGSRSAATSDSPDAHRAGVHIAATTHTTANGHVPAPAFDMAGPVPSLWVGSLAPRVEKSTLEGLFRHPPTSCKIVAPLVAQ